MVNKKSQSQIISTVLIILLVLAAIVIVWQVVNSTIKGGAKEIGEVSACQGINIEVESTVYEPTATPPKATFSIRRRGGGDITGAKLKVIKDDTGSPEDLSATFCTGGLSPSPPDWSKDFSSATCSFNTVESIPTNSLEAIVYLSNGKPCPISGRWEK